MCCGCWQCQHIFTNLTEICVPVHVVEGRNPAVLLHARALSRSHWLSLCAVACSLALYIAQLAGVYIFDRTHIMKQPGKATAP